MNSRTRTHAGTLLILSAALSTAVLLIIVGYTGKTPAAAAQNVVATLYDGSLGGGTQTPDDQEFSYSALVLPPQTVQASQSASGGVTSLDTMEPPIRRPSPSPL